MDMNEGMNLNTLIALLGKPFIAYTCNLNDDELVGRTNETVTLNNQKETALQVLLMYSAQIYDPSQPSDEFKANLIASLSDYSSRFADAITYLETGI
jgi:hypothetical protein